MLALLGQSLAPAPAYASRDRRTAAPPTQNLCEREMIAASARSGVPLGVLYAVGLTETGSSAGMQPYALNIEGRTVQPRSLEEALRIVHREQGRGATLIDVGCMQINLHYHQKSFDSLKAMFDPAENVDYAARFLQQLRWRHGTWSMAVARYHAGAGNDAAQKRYVCSVIRRMIDTGFGRVTPRAATFCGI